ncbi:probable methylcrotonoyl-CoA carboxylase beta chain, mitochondrial [Aquarana catesbeiana]|uniref:probable methylcrotonoyl-CoA carboxylase beta chain, mitochondrial n=1 Tax=Aquarana catesbeiana TaxID=8400 RepID=UPI003CCA0C17
MAALRLYRHLLQPPQCCRLSSRAAQAFPVLRGDILPIHRHVNEANSRNSERCRERYLELTEKVKLGGGENAILRHTQRNKKLLVRERLKLLLDNENFLELSPLVGLGLPYGDVPSAGCLAG